MLAGIDDGPPTIEGSLALARAAAEAGTGTLVATPHVNATHPNDADTIAALREQLAARLAEEGIPLELLSGAEIAVSQVSAIAEDELARLTLGGGPYLLIEPPYAPLATGVDAIVLELLDRGHRVLLAHPERCPGFQREPALVERLVDEGVLTSITAASLAGRFGGTVRRFALRLLERGLVHNVASDAHDHARRPPGLAAPLEDAGLGALGDWLTEQVPAAILAGEEIPLRPQAAITGGAGRRWWQRGR